MLSESDQITISRICDKEPEKTVEFATSLLSALGKCDKQEFADLFFINKRTVERKCKSGEISNIYGFPLINVYIKKLQNETKSK